MTDAFRFGALLLCIMLMAAIAGFFYAYSVSVIWGFDDVDPATAISAMQGVNRVVRNAWFAPAFFGALLAPALIGLMLLAGGYRSVAILTLAAAVIYGLGGFALTLMLNVPLNEALASVAMSSDPDAMARVWRNYRHPWMIGNHARTIASFVALASLLAALWLEGRSKPAVSR